MSVEENQWHGTDRWGDEFDIVDVPVGKPRMTWTIEAMTNYPARDRDDTAELVDILRMTEEIHYSLEENADRHRRYGRCVECGEWWPCPSFEMAKYAAVEWLVNASNAIMRRNGLIGPALPIGGKPAPPDMVMLECYYCGGDCRGVSEAELARLVAIHELMKCEDRSVKVEPHSNGHPYKVGD